MDDEPTYDISVTSMTGAAPDHAEHLRPALRAAFLRHRVHQACVTVALVDDVEMARLNELHLGHKGPTDVLSFDLRDRKQDDSTTFTDRDVEADIVVSIDTAAREADRRGHDLSAELALYAVHGALHLLGYDDQEERGAARMHEVEDEILTSIGIGPVYRPELR